MAQTPRERQIWDEIRRLESLIEDAEERFARATPASRRSIEKQLSELRQQVKGLRLSLRM